MAKLGYDQYQSLRFRSDHSLWGDAGLAFRLQFFHVGRSFTEPVHLYEVVDGQAREIVYDPAMFEWDKSGIDPAIDEGPRGLCRLSRAVRHQLEGRRRRLSGRELFSRGGRRHAAVRPVGARLGGRYRVPAARGISALHLVLVRAAGEGFRHHDAVCPDGLARASPALCACRSRPAARSIMDIDSALYPRKPIERLGIAPLTSMFFYGENDRRAAQRLAARDPRFRRPVDVDRRRRMDLAAAHQSGAAAFQFLFRRQPARLRPAAAGPKFRSLSGRRRVLRPAAEPVGRAKAGPNGGWGKGAVQLVEIPDGR